MATAFLERRGLSVTERNIRVGRGEIDLIAVDGSERIAVEVKTRLRSGLDPMENFTAAKRAQVRALALSLRPRVYRVDFVGVAISDRDVVIRWVPHAA